MGVERGMRTIERMVERALMDGRTNAKDCASVVARQSACRDSLER